MRLPRKPVRTFFRALFRLIGTAIAVALDLDEPRRAETRPRAARRISTDARRGSQS